MPLMSYNEYQHKRHSIPYMFTLESSGNYIYYFGESHSFDPEHPQCPDEKYERSELEKKFTREEIQCYYFARIVHQWHRKNPRPDFEGYVNRYLENDKEESGWTDFDFSLDAMKKIHGDIFNTEFDMNDTDFFSKAINPTKGMSVVNAVSRASSAIRDEYIVEQICKYVKEGYSIYLQFGATHAVIQEPLLRELLVQ